MVPITMKIADMTAFTRILYLQALEDELLAEMFLDAAIRKRIAEQLRAEIDQALDSGDREKFMELTKGMKE